ncbi:MAG: PKD domain-containing protein [Candidatus Thermoplasmatota archaeon]|nr:PKD domain-containing protein [Candidatus Thermoplasmatota archaeon]
MFGNVTRPLSSLPRGYDLNGVIERPVGSDISISSDEFSPSLIKLQKRLDHEHAGTYLISGTLVNTFCHIDSPFRTVTIENNDTFQYDAEPFAFAGEDLYTNISGGARVTLDGSGSWDDGTITEYHWDLGDGTTETSDHPTIQHSYTEQGTYYVELTVTDDSGKSSGNQGGTASSLKVTVSA